MDVSGGTGIIKTALQAPEFAKPVVENLIQVLAQVGSVGIHASHFEAIPRLRHGGSIRQPFGLVCEQWFNRKTPNSNTKTNELYWYHC